MAAQAAGAKRAALLGAGLALLTAHLATASAFLLAAGPGTDAALRGLPLDDAWIHLVYARSLAHGEGLAYNPGAQEVGCTAPLWTLLEVPAVWLGDALGTTPVLGVKLLGVALAVALSATMLALLLRLGFSLRVALLAALLPALDPSLSFAKVSGMEVILAALLPLLALERTAAGREVQAAAALGLAPLARPESSLLVALGALLLARRWWKDSSRPAAAIAGALALALPWLAWMGVCLLISGRPLPGTFYVKFSSGAAFLDNLFVVLGPMLSELPYFFAGAGLVLLALGAQRLVRGSAGGRRDVALLLLALPLVHFVAIAWSHRLDQATPFYWNRYFQPAIPALQILLALGAASLVAWAFAEDRIRWRRSARIALAGCLLLLSVCTLPSRWLASRERFAWNCQNIEEMQVALGRWLRDHTAEDEWIAAIDAGAIRYFSERRTLDLVGLNDLGLQIRGLRARLQETRPRLYAVFPKWRGRIGPGSRLRLVHEVTSPNYTICDCPQRRMVVYERMQPL